MPMTRLLDPLLELITKQQKTMQLRVESMINDAITTLWDPGLGLGKDAARKDEEVNRLEKTIEQTVLESLCRHQPYARDLRFLVVTLYIISDLEHMGDDAKEICEALGQTGPDFRPSSSLLEFSHLVLKKVSDCFRALSHYDLELAKELATTRKEHEAFFDRLVQELQAFDRTEKGLQFQIRIAVALRRISACGISIVDQLILLN